MHRELAVYQITFYLRINEWNQLIDWNKNIWCHSSLLVHLHLRIFDLLHFQPGTLCQPQGLREEKDDSAKWLSCKPVQQHTFEALPKGQMFPSSIPYCHLSKPCSRGRKQTLMSSESLLEVKYASQYKESSEHLKRLLNKQQSAVCFSLLCLSVPLLLLRWPSWCIHLGDLSSCPLGLLENKWAWI